MAAIGGLIRSLPAESALHLGNSSTVRYAQLYTVPETVEVCCNRGTSGIEGSLSTAIGYSVCSEKLNFIVIGDLSFFYDMNALWNDNLHNNLRILLLNNGGGEIFQALPGFKMNERTHRFVTAYHQTFCQRMGQRKRIFLPPLSIMPKNRRGDGAFHPNRPPSEQPMLMEVFHGCVRRRTAAQRILSPTKNSSQLIKQIIYGNKKENGQPSKNMKKSYLISTTASPASLSTGNGIATLSHRLRPRK